MQQIQYRMQFCPIPSIAAAQINIGADLLIDKPTDTNPGAKPLITKQSQSITDSSR